MGAILEINESDFDAEVLKSDQVVLVSFWAAWSEPCRIVKPILNEIAAEGASRTKIVQVNVDDNPHLGMWYGIQSIPTLLYFLNGETAERIVGTASKEAILGGLKRITAAVPLIPNPLGKHQAK